MEPPRREELERRLLDVPLSAVQLLEEQDPRAFAREHGGERILRSSVLHDRQADEIRRLEKAQIENGGRDAKLARHAPDDLALADPGGPFEQHGAPRPIGDREDVALEARADRDGERAETIGSSRLRRYGMPRRHA